MNHFISHCRLIDPVWMVWVVVGWLSIPTDSFGQRAFLQVDDVKTASSALLSAGDPAISADGLTMVAISGSPADLVLAKRENLTAQFSAPQTLTALNSDTADVAPCLSSNGLTLYFASDRTGGRGGYDLYESNRPTVDDNFSQVARMRQINTSSDETDPTVSADGLTLYFAGNRAGGRGGMDIFIATRTSLDGAFGSVRPVVGVNTAYDERQPAISPDGRTLYFTRSRSGDSTSARIMVCTLAGGGASTPLELAELNALKGASGPAPSNVDSFLYSRAGRLTEVKGSVAEGIRRYEIGAGFLFPEGPAIDAEGQLLISACESPSVVRFNRNGTIETYIHYGNQPNGLAFDREGNLYAADAPLHGIVKIKPDRSWSVLADHAGDHAFTRPNDLVIDRDGNIYTTDPMGWGANDPTGYVYRIAPDGTATIALQGIGTPNGIQLSPNDEWLYVAATREQRVVRARILADGKLGPVETHASVPDPDGMSIDSLGNLYVASYSDSAVYVFDPQGNRLARLFGGSQNTTNVCFGGSDFQSIFVTSPGDGVVSRMWIGIPGLKLYAQREDNAGVVDYPNY